MFVHPAFDKCFVLGLVIGLAVCVAVLPGCTSQWFDDSMGLDGVGGGQDLIYIDMPFADGYSARCTQGPGGDYSHSYNSTRYDVDFDTPNDVDDYVYAPVSGVAYVHTSPEGTGFGTHVNIDLGDGTYITVAHLKSVFIDLSEEVARGQLLGFEGSTGNSSGDHVHIGRHRGSATNDAGQGTSVEGLAFNLKWPGGDEIVTDMDCGLEWGTSYTSANQTTLWHPNGSLLKSPRENVVYLLEDQSIRPFADEMAFWSRNYDFSDLSLVSENELSCYTPGVMIRNENSIRVVEDGGEVWLLIGTLEDVDRTRLRVQTLEWQAVLVSWGIRAYDINTFETNASLSNILADYPVATGFLEIRDGALVTEQGTNTVYMVSDGVAMPIENWDVFLMLDFFGHDLIVLEDGSLRVVQSKVGDCSSNIHCLSPSDLIVCGGPAEATEGVSNEQDVDNDPDTDSEQADDVDSDTDTEPEDYLQYHDADGDGYGDDSVTYWHYSPIMGYVAIGGDCDDTDPTRNVDCSTPVDDEEDIESAVMGELTIKWQTPMGLMADRISLSGEMVTSAGLSSGWQANIAQNFNDTEVEHTFASVQAGDSFRFSVEFVRAGTTSWSCLAPFPSGTIQGTPSAFFAGSSLVVNAVADPASAGCGLLVTVP